MASIRQAHMAQGAVATRRGMSVLGNGMRAPVRADNHAQHGDGRGPSARLSPIIPTGKTAAGHRPSLRTHPLSLLATGGRPGCRASGLPARAGQNRHLSGRRPAASRPRSSAGEPGLARAHLGQDRRRQKLEAVRG